MVTQVDRIMVYSPELEKVTTRGVTGLSGYTRTSKVQYVMGADQSLYWEQDGNVIISVEVWDVYIEVVSVNGIGKRWG